MSNLFNKINSEFLLSLIFLNYLIYFFFDTKVFFVYFSIIILFSFFLILFKNSKINLYLVLTIIILSLISLGSPVSDWDGRSIWLFNAKRIFYNSYLQEYTSYYTSEFSHLDYPIMVQTLSASLASMIGHWNEIFPKFSSIIISLPALLMISKIVKNNLEKIIFLILIFFIYEKRLISGEMDALLALYSCASLILLIEISKLKKLNIRHLAQLFLYLMTLTMIKIEGLGILICLCGSYCIIYYRNNIKVGNQIIFIFLLSLIPLVLWKLYIFDKNIISSSSLMISGGERFFENLLNFKFLLILFKEIWLNKQMFIAIVILLFSLSKYIYINQFKIEISIDKILLKKNLIFTIFSALAYFILLLFIFIASEGSPNNIQEQYFMATTSSDRIFLPIHSMLILFSIYLNHEKNKS